MTLIPIYTSDDRYEHVRADRIESVREPGTSPNDHGSVRLQSGQIISLGRSIDQWKRIVKEWQEAVPAVQP